VPLLKRIFTIATIAFPNFTILKRFRRSSEDIMASRREQMQEHIESPEWTESGPENVFRFYPGPLAAERGDNPADGEDGSAALQLVYQLADVVRSREEHAAQVEARAQALGKRAIDELNLADERLRATEAARNAAEAALNKANATVQEFEAALKHTEARITTAETQLSEALRRAKTAETRATKSEMALKRLEDAIRIQLLNTRGPAPRNSAAAA
jgi:hypothetical protein